MTENTQLRPQAPKPVVGQRFRWTHNNHALTGRVAAISPCGTRVAAIDDQFGQPWEIAARRLRPILEA